MSIPERTTGEIGTAEAYCPQCGRSFTIGTAHCPDDNTTLAQLAADHEGLIGHVLDGRFEITATLGRGGMGMVYRGKQLSVDREVAIKVIHPKLTSDRAVVKRFLREARLASRLNHPAIVAVIDSGQSGNVLYLATELLRGHTLERELERGRAMPVRRAMAIALQLCDALGAAHASGIVHRDLKPANVMILDDPSARDHVKVLDFGLAKSFRHDDRVGSQVTNLGVLTGTPAYMAPEQIGGEPTDPRTDLYALGCMLYEMVTGAPPFVEPALSAILARQIGDTPAALPETLPAAFRTLVARLLVKSPADRPQTAAEVRGALELLLGTPHVGVELVPTASYSESPTHAAPLSMLAAAPSPRRRRTWAIAAAAIAGLLVIAVGTWRLLGDDDGRAAPTAAPIVTPPPSQAQPTANPTTPTAPATPTAPVVEAPATSVGSHSTQAPSNPATVNSGSTQSSSPPPSHPATVAPPIKHAGSPPRPTAKPGAPQPQRPTTGSAAPAADIDFYHGQ